MSASNCRSCKAVVLDYFGKANNTLDHLFTITILEELVGIMTVLLMNCQCGDWNPWPVGLQFPQEKLLASHQMKEC
jgi:hypothetical protein